MNLVEEVRKAIECNKNESVLKAGDKVTLSDLDGLSATKLGTDIATFGILHKYIGKTATITKVGKTYSIKFDNGVVAHNIPGNNLKSTSECDTGKEPKEEAVNQGIKKDLESLMSEGPGVRPILEALLAILHEAEKEVQTKEEKDGLAEVASGVELAIQKAKKYKVQ